MSQTLHGILFVSRNKDNKEIPNFKERRKVYLLDDVYQPDGTISEDLQYKFDKFVNEGSPGEVCRLYVSVNTRHPEKTRVSLQHFLLDHPEFPLTNIHRKLVSLAMLPENRLTRYFLLDVDFDGIDDPESNLKEVEHFIQGATILDEYITPNGYHFITQGFDTRTLLEAFPNITLKRDGLKLVTTKMHA